VSWLCIDPEFQSLIPPLSTEELQQLEENVTRDGCRDPLVVWGGTIVDGHNRYEICCRHGLKFDTVEMEFDGRDAAMDWIDSNQLGRRNLPPYVKTEIALRRKARIAARAKENQIRKPVDSVCQNSDKQKIDTKREIAKAAGVSHDTVAKVEKIQKLAPEPVKEKLRTGEISINQAYKDITADEKKKKRAEEIAAQKEAIETGAVSLPAGVFEVVAMDPPWNYGREYDPDGSRIANPYPEMTQQQLLEMKPPFADDSVLFLWTTHQFIWDAKQLMDAWGFTYKATLVWDKQKIGMGSWVRMQCEFCLLGIRGKPTWNNTQWRDLIQEPRREHSRKPEKFYELAEAVTVGRRLDYFSREARPGWEAFGNDTQKF